MLVTRRQLFVSERNRKISGGPRQDIGDAFTDAIGIHKLGHGCCSRDRTSVTKERRSFSHITRSPRSTSYCSGLLWQTPKSADRTLTLFRNGRVPATPGTRSCFSCRSLISRRRRHGVRTCRDRARATKIQREGHFQLGGRQP
jgi:hypothetical protein